MKFIPYHACGWHSDDAAHLYFYRTDQQLYPPNQLHCERIGRAGIVRPFTVSVSTAELQFLGAGLFGSPRTCKGSKDMKWTGDAYKFGIYQRAGDVVIIRQDGSGTRAYIEESLTALETWSTLCSLSSEMRWNVCMLVAHTYHCGRDAEREHVYGKFLEGRLKRIRRKGGVFVLETSSL